MTTDPTYPLGQPLQMPPTVTPAPSAMPMNLASLSRLAMTLIAGVLVQKGLADAQNAQLYAGLVLAIAAAAWNLAKNASVIKRLIGAMQAPAMTVVNPVTMNALPPVAPPPGVVTAILVAALCLPGFMMLPSCASTAVPPSAELTLAKTNYAFEKSYNTAAHLYLETWAPGKTAEQKKPVKDAFAKAYLAVQAAETANAAGNTAEYQTQVALVAGFVAKAMAAMNPPAH